MQTESGKHGLNGITSPPVQELGNHQCLGFFPGNADNKLIGASDHGLPVAYLCSSVLSQTLRPRRAALT